MSRVNSHIRVTGSHDWTPARQRQQTVLKGLYWQVETATMTAVQ